jgi:hypothetical protein
VVRELVVHSAPPKKKMSGHLDSPWFTTILAGILLLFSSRSVREMFNIYENTWEKRAMWIWSDLKQTHIHQQNVALLDSIDSMILHSHP